MPGMSNKPLRLAPKGRQLPSPGSTESPSSSPRWQTTLSHSRKSTLAKAGLLLGLAAVCLCYTLSPTEKAVAVVAGKRELPIYSVERKDKSIAISFDASWGADNIITDVPDIGLTKI